MKRCAERSENINDPSGVSRPARRTLPKDLFFMTYDDQLKDVRWLVRRNEILERDDYCCQDCLRSPRNRVSGYIQLQVHHFKYISGLMAWEYDDKYLITLCRGCHAKWHKLIPDHRPEREKPVFVYGIRDFESQPIKHISQVLYELAKSIVDGE